MRVKIYTLKSAVQTVYFHISSNSYQLQFSMSTFICINQTLTYLSSEIIHCKFALFRIFPYSLSKAIDLLYSNKTSILYCTYRSGRQFNQKTFMSFSIIIEYRRGHAVVNSNQNYHRLYSYVSTGNFYIITQRH